MNGDEEEDEDDNDRTVVSSDCVPMEVPFSKVAALTRGHPPPTDSNLVVIAMVIAGSSGRDPGFQRNRGC